MGWARIDDDFPNHPKVWRVGIDGVALFLEGLCHASKFLTDGLLKREDVERMRLVKRPLVTAAKLVDVGLWEQEGDDFRIHDYHDYNPTSESVRERRASTRGRVQAHRDRHVCNAVTDRVTDAVTSVVTDTVSNVNGTHARALATRDGTGVSSLGSGVSGGEPERGLDLTIGQLRPAVLEVVGAWNRSARDPFVLVRDDLSDEASRRVLKALRAHPNVGWWALLFDEVVLKSSFLAGGGDRGWVADFWWVLENADAIESGRYRDRVPQTKPSRIGATSAEWRRRCVDRGHDPSCDTPTQCELRQEKAQRVSA